MEVPYKESLGFRLSLADGSDMLSHQYPPETEEGIGKIGLANYHDKQFELKLNGDNSTWANFMWNTIQIKLE